MGFTEQEEAALGGVLSSGQVKSGQPGREGGRVFLAKGTASAKSQAGRARMPGSCRQPGERCRAWREGEGDGETAFPFEHQVQPKPPRDPACRWTNPAVGPARPGASVSERKRHSRARSKLMKGRGISWPRGFGRVTSSISAAVSSAAKGWVPNLEGAGRF